jgi:peptide chain release factor 1
MFKRLEAAENRYDELTMKLSDPSVIANQEEYRRLMKEHSDLEDIVLKFREYKKVLKEMEDAKEMLNDKGLDRELKDMAQMEVDEASDKLEVLKREIKILLLPKDPNDDKSVIVEIRGGAGGEEAALFASDLYRMYTRYAERNRWSYELLDSNETEIGGFKEVVFSIDARGAFSKLKFESGVHRVQRIPSTESGGRIHTSTVTVAVLPEVEEVDVNINMNDLRIDTYRASGAGGQHINKTDSAIRITHIPTGLVVTCQDQRSQHKNKERALSVLRSKLYEMEQEKQTSEYAQARKSQVGTGDRSEKIRTYNFPQSRITDHRIGFTAYNMEAVLDGDMEALIDALVTADQAERLTGLGVED